MSMPDLDTALRPTNEGPSWLESYRAFYDIILKAVSAVRTSLPDWDLFRWVVVSLLAANCTLLTIVWTDVGSEFAEFKQEQDGLVKQVAEMRTAQAEAGRAQYVQDTRVTNEPENAREGPAQPISIIRPRVTDEAAKAKLQAMTSGQKPMAKARH
jgi:hypothetical protein